MSDKELIARGAEVVTGDLILNRKVVGHYRNGQFVITPEGAYELENVVEAVTKEVVTRTPRVPKALKNVVAPDEPTVVTEPNLTESLDDLLKD